MGAVDGSLKIDTSIDTAGFADGLARMKASMAGFAKALGAVFSVAAIAKFVKDSIAEYRQMEEAQAKLTRVMRNTMKARDDEIRSIMDLIDAQEALGVVSGDAQTAGAQELGTYLTLKSSLETLLPVMNDMVAQQLGIGASGESVVNIATMMGKVVDGQVGALSRYGYTFDKVQEKILKTGTEMQRAAVLAEVVSQSVGGMNFALAQTDTGRQWQLAQAFGAVKEQFGAAFSQIGILFLPALNAVANALAVVANLARQAAQYIALLFGKQITGADAAAKGYGGVASGAGAAAKAQDELAEATEGAGKAAKGALAAFDDLNVLQQNSGGGSSGGGADYGGGGAGGGIGDGQIGIAEDVEISPAFIAAMEYIRKLLEPLQEIDLSNLKDAFDDLKTAVEPLTRALFSGLEWAWFNLLVPFAAWTVQDAVPAFLRLLAAAADVLSSAIETLKPFAQWLWNDLLKPLAKFAGQAILDFLAWLTEGLKSFSNWILEHQGTVETLAKLAISLAAGFLLVSIALGVVKAATTAFNAVMTLLSNPFLLVALAIGLLIFIIWQLVDNWEAVKQALINTWNNVVETFWADIEWLKWAFSAAWSAIVQFFVGAWNRITEKAQEVWEALVGIWNLASEWFFVNVILPVWLFFVGLWESIKMGVASAWTAVVAAWEGALTWFNDTVVNPVRDAFDTAVKAISGFFSTAWTDIQLAWVGALIWFNDTVVNPVQNAFDTAVAKIKEFFETGWANIKLAWEVALTWFSDTVINPVREAFATALTKIKEFFETGWDNIKTAWEGAKKWFDDTIIDPVKTAFDTALSSISGFFGTAWDNIVKAWTGALEWFNTTFINPIKTAFESVATFIAGIINKIIGVVNSMIGGVETGINAVVSAINSIGFDIPPISAFGTVIWEGASVRPNISPVSFGRVPEIPLPKLATGAVIPPNAEFAAILGDQRHGRNLEAPEGLIRQIVREESGAAGDIVVRFEGTLAQFVRMLKPEIERENRRIGRPLVTGGAIR